MQLEEILPYYLPHKLTMKYVNDTVTPSWRYLDAKNLEFLSKTAKPLLWPLSYLDKPIIHNGEEIIVTEKLGWNAWTLTDKGLDNICLTFRDWNFLLSYHFNVFNLSEDQYISKAKTENVK